MVSIFKALPSRKDTRLVSSEFAYGGGKDKDSSLPEKDSSLTPQQMKAMYERNVWVRAVVDRIKDRASNVPPVIKAIIPSGKYKPTDEQNKKIDEIKKLVFTKPNDMGESFQSIRKKCFHDTLVYDASAIEWVREVVHNKIVEMYSVSGPTIRLNVDKRGIFRDEKKAYEQIDESNQHLVWLSKNELCYMISNPRANNVYGFSPLETLQQTVTAELYSADFNLQRFVNDATPRFAVLMGGLGVGQTSPAIVRFREWWDKEMKGNPHRPMILATEGDKIEFVKVGLTQEEMQFQEYSVWLLRKIMSIYKMQPFVLGVIEGTTGKLNSQQQEEQFKKDAIRPLLDHFSWYFNTQVVWADDSYNWGDIYLHWKDVDILDEKATAEMHEKYLRLGVFTINRVLNELGYEGVPWGDIPYMQMQYQPLGYAGIPPAPKPSGRSTEKMLQSLRVEPSELKRAISKILNARESALNQFWSFPNEVGIRNMAKALDFEITEEE